MRIAMIGTGYVGLVSGACFSEFGIEVVCVDLDAEKIARLEEGIMPIYEPGLEALVANNVGAGRLSFTTDLAAAVVSSDAVFIAVGTPSRRGDGHADLSYVHAAAAQIALEQLLPQLLTVFDLFELEQPPRLGGMRPHLQVRRVRLEKGNHLARFFAVRHRDLLCFDWRFWHR